MVAPLGSSVSTLESRMSHMTNHPEDTPLAAVAADIKARWVCEQGHQQMKEELGLDHLECRNWTALRHHTVLTMIALCFLQHVRLGEKKGRRQRLVRATSAANAWSGPPPQPTLPQIRRQIVKELLGTIVRCPCCHTLIPYYPRL
jgi:SRSO17 transposase